MKRGKQEVQTLSETKQNKEYGGSSRILHSGLFAPVIIIIIIITTIAIIIITTTTFTITIAIIIIIIIIITQS